MMDFRRIEVKEAFRDFILNKLQQCNKTTQWLLDESNLSKDTLCDRILANNLADKSSPTERTRTKIFTALNTSFEEFEDYYSGQFTVYSQQKNQPVQFWMGRNASEYFRIEVFVLLLCLVAVTVGIFYFSAKSQSIENAFGAYRNVTLYMYEANYQKFRQELVDMAGKLRKSYEVADENMKKIIENKLEELDRNINELDVEYKNSLNQLKNEIYSLKLKEVTESTARYLSVVSHNGQLKSELNDVARLADNFSENCHAMPGNIANTVSTRKTKATGLNFYPGDPEKQSGTANADGAGNETNGGTDTAYREDRQNENVHTAGISTVEIERIRVLESFIRHYKKDVIPELLKTRNAPIRWDSKIFDSKVGLGAAFGPGKIGDHKHQRNMTSWFLGKLERNLASSVFTEYCGLIENCNTRLSSVYANDKNEMTLVYLLDLQNKTIELGEASLMFKKFPEKEKVWLFDSNTSTKIYLINWRSHHEELFARIVETVDKYIKLGPDIVSLVFQENNMKRYTVDSASNHIVEFELDKDMPHGKSHFDVLDLADFDTVFKNNQCHSSCHFSIRHRMIELAMNQY